MKPKQILDLEKAWGIEIEEDDVLWNDKVEITTLWIVLENIKDLSPIQGLSNLIQLALSDNQISDLSPIQGLSNLEILYLPSNQITDLSPIQGLSNLTNLDLSENQITDLSPIQGLSNLTELYLQDNQITDLSPIQGLSNLTELYLQDNQISDLSPIQGLSNLEVLNLANNQIADIRPIRHLIIKKIEISYTNTWDLMSINLYNNPLAPALIEAIEQGNEAVLEYLDNLDKEEAKGSRPLNEAKMIVLGNVGAGKSSLVNYLVGKPFVETKSTEGFRIERWEIEDDTDKYRINVWDFGGDEIQQTLHRFFLTQDALYVVVVDARFEENPNKYLEEIKSYAPNSPVLVVVNRTDEKYWGVNEAQLLAEYRSPSGEPMIKGFFKTSVLQSHKELNPHFLPALRALDDVIVRQLLAMPTLRQSVPSNYFEVKSYLESRFFKDTPYITHELYEQLCRDKNLELASDDALLGVLDRLGTIRYFDKTHTRNLHILNPEWLSDGVYRILTAEHTHNLRGVISEKDFPTILQKTEKHVFTYPKQHYGYLIKMIEQFYLGYVQPETEKIFIPQAFGSDYPAHLDSEGYKTKALHFFFKYETHIPSGAISSFIARTFGQVQGHLYWQKGIVINKSEHNETQVALVMQTDIKNRIDVWVQGQHRQAFFLEIRQIFRQFHEKYIALKVDEMVGLDAQRNTAVPYRVLIAHKHKGKTDYTDEEGNDYTIDDLLGNIERPKDTQQAIGQQFDIRNYYDLRGATHIQFVRHEAQAISTELSELMAENQQMSEQNKALLDKLIADLKEIQKVESPAKSKGILAQLRDTAKNLPKIASEEGVKWAAKTGLDKIPFEEKIKSIYEKLVDLLPDLDLTGFENL
jgi:internalin A